MVVIFPIMPCIRAGIPVIMLNEEVQLSTKQ